MDDQSLYSPINGQVQLPEQEQLRCPRCDSANTKFCYYNNYNLSQPRHYCRACRRYWTRGGTLRNIPVGGGSRKNSRRGSVASATAAAQEIDAGDVGSPGVLGCGMGPPVGGDVDGQFGDSPVAGGRFATLLGSAACQKFGNFVDGMQMGDPYGDVPGRGQNMDPRGLVGGDGGVADGFLGLSGEGDGWPDLSMYPPGSTYL